MKITSIFLFSIILILLSCRDNSNLNQVQIIFDQSEYFVLRNCENPANGKLKIAVLNRIESMSCIIRADDKIIHEYFLPDTELTKASGYNERFIFEFDLPKGNLSGQDSVVYIAGVSGEKGEELFSQSVVIHFVNPEDEISYVARNWYNRSPLSRGRWKNYKGEGVPGNSEYVALKDLQIDDIKIGDSWQRKFNFEITLKNEVSAEIIEINPPLDMTFNLHPDIELYQNGRLLFKEQMPIGIGNFQVIHSYETKNESEFYMPGYILYEMVYGDLIHGTVAVCDSVNIISTEELIFPYKIELSLGSRVRLDE